ncbi:MAG: hypothetical protein HY762_06830 [Planctomycetes bacterium]|nr:hypothetical protein [Planctomycetota bacterium]
MAAIEKTGLILVVPEEFPAAEDMGPKWVQGMTNNATLIKSRLDAKIPDAGMFEQKLVAPAAEAYSPYVPVGFISKRGRTQAAIQNTHRKNLATAYNRWNDKLALAFETVDGVEAKRFKDQVANTVDAWLERVRTKTLRLTGDKVRGRGVSVIAGFWLTGEKETVSGMLREGDQAMGQAYDIAYDTQRPGFRAGLTQILTQTGVLVINSDMMQSVMDEQNNRLKTMLTALSDRAKSNEFAYPYDATKSYCAFEFSEDKGLYLRIRVVLGV